MTNSNLPDSNWDRSKVRLEYVDEMSLEGATREQLVTMILDLCTALHPFATTLSAIGDNDYRGTIVTSKLFPHYRGKETFLIFDGSKFIEQDKIPEAELHDVEYEERESITITKGEDLSDLFVIMNTTQQLAGASINRGDISMGDVRYALCILRERMCTCLTSSQDDAYNPGGPMSGKTRPPLCKVHPNQDGKMSPIGDRKPSGPIKD